MLCRREGLASNIDYRWSKDFLEAGKKRLAGDAVREAASDEVKRLRRESLALKQAVADLTLEMIGIPRATFYRWYDLYQTGGPEALEDRSPRPGRVWNRIPDPIRGKLVHLALEQPELSPRELAVRFTDTESYFVSETSVYRLLKTHDLITSPAFIVMKAADGFKNKTTAPNQLWQTDSTYLKVAGWAKRARGHDLRSRLGWHAEGWFYLSTVLDDFSRTIVAWKLCTTMAASDVTDTLNLALQASGLERERMRHIRGAPFHPMTQGGATQGPRQAKLGGVGGGGKIERWHQTLKNRILLENYYLPGNLEAEIATFVDHYNTRRYHESLDKLAPADVYSGRGDAIRLERQRIKRQTLLRRRLQHIQHAA